MKIEELVRYSWISGMGSYHDTKTSKQLNQELEIFMEGIADELKLFNTLNVSVAFSYNEGYKQGYNDATKESCEEIAKNYHPNER